MFRLRDKWVRKYKAMPIAIAVVYLVVTFITPLNHTCGLGEIQSKHSCFTNSDHNCSGEFNTNLRFDIAAKQNQRGSKTLSHQDLCIACLYSTIFKYTQVNTKTTFIAIEVSSPFQISPLSRIAKRREWLFSVSLRAPPIITS